MWDTFKQYLVKNYGYDAGHSLVGPLLGLLLYSLGVAPHLAATIGGLAYALPKEVYDCNKHNHLPNKDNVADLVSYQTAWPAVYWADQQTVPAIALLILVAVVYSALVIWKLAEE